MYEQRRIISTPVGNNRLNFHERENPSIIVPSLITGTIADVKISGDTVIEGEVGGKIMAGKGLENFVFLKNALVPTWIFDNHNHAFAFWHEALWNGYIRPGSLLVHIDQHTDLATPDKLPPWKTIKETNAREVETYTNTSLTIANFILPALTTGLLSEVLIITGESLTGSGMFSWDNGFHKSPAVTIQEKLDQYPGIIVDIDLDYFSQGFEENLLLKNVEFWIRKADSITIATSPLFIEQEGAISVLKSLQSSLVAL